MSSIHVHHVAAIAAPFILVILPYLLKFTIPLATSPGGLIAVAISAIVALILSSHLAWCTNGARLSQLFFCLPFVLTALYWLINSDHPDSILNYGSYLLLWHLLTYFVALSQVIREGDVPASISNNRESRENATQTIIPRHAVGYLIAFVSSAALLAAAVTQAAAGEMGGEGIEVARAFVYPLSSAILISLSVYVFVSIPKGASHARHVAIAAIVTAILAAIALTVSWVMQRIHVDNYGRTEVDTDGLLGTRTIFYWIGWPLNIIHWCIFMYAIEISYTRPMDVQAETSRA